MSIHTHICVYTHAYIYSTFRGVNYIHLTFDFTLRRVVQRDMHREIEGIRENLKLQWGSTWQRFQQWTLFNIHNGFKYNSRNGMIP